MLCQKKFNTLSRAHNNSFVFDFYYLCYVSNYNFARGFVWVSNLVADIEGGTQAEGVEESIWT
jgi:hypothetical protein